MLAESRQQAASKPPESRQKAARKLRESCQQAEQSYDVIPTLLRRFLILKYFI